MKIKEVILVASGDSRPSANITCWSAQQDMEQKLTNAFARFNIAVKRGHAFDAIKQHGVIDSQKMGIEVFKNIHENAAVVVAESMWQYSHHVLAGLTTHKGPILTVANWSGQWPGLVGLLNLNGSLTKAGVAYNTIWSENFEDEYFLNALDQWIIQQKIEHDDTHVSLFSNNLLPSTDAHFAKSFATNFKKNKAIMGVFDEGCMGMYNAIIPDATLHATGLFKERLSQSALYAEILTVTDAEANDVLEWLLQKGMQFDWGNDEATTLTKRQTLEQCKMYIAAVRIADHFGCATIGIQYQQGLKDTCAASDLVEGLLNNKERPPVYNAFGDILFKDNAIPHFNEVDQCAGLDGLITYQLWNQLGMSGENTLHDLRWGQWYKDENIDAFVWVLLISGAAPPAHFVGGYSGTTSMRQPAMYFPKGGGTVKGISKPGNIIWSRVYVENDKLFADIGTGNVVSLPAEETERRWNGTTKEWPIMHAVFNGVSQNQMMAKHKANHIQVVYVTDAAMASRAALIKAAVFENLGIQVNICGKLN